MTPLERQDLARSSTHVQIRLLQDLHQSWLESRDLEAIPNPSNEPYRIDLRADMLEEGTYKVWRCQRIQRVYSPGRVSEYCSRSSQRSSSACSLAKSIA